MAHGRRDVRGVGEVVLLVRVAMVGLRRLFAARDAGAADVTANGAPGRNGVKQRRQGNRGTEDGRPGRPRASGTLACHNLPMQDVSHLPALVTGLAFVLAAVFGAVATRVNFCTMGAISDVVNFGDSRRLRMWLLAIAVAIAGTGALQAAGLVDLSKTLYTGSRVGWLSLAGRRIPVRLRDDAGLRLRQQDADPRRRRQPEIADRARVLRGLRLHDAEGPLRAVAHDGARSGALRRRGARRQDLRSAVDPRRARARAARSSCGFPFAFAAAIAAWVFANREFRATPEMIVGGIVIGAVIVGGWYVSGHLGYSPRIRRRSRRNSSPPTRAAPSRSATRRRSPTCWSC